MDQLKKFALRKKSGLSSCLEETLIKSCNFTSLCFFCLCEISKDFLRSKIQSIYCFLMQFTDFLAFLHDSF